MKNPILLLALLFSILGSSQELYKIDYIFTDNNSQKINCSLFSNNNEALFKFYDSRERGILDLPNGEMAFVENDELSRFYYSNSTTTYSRILIYGDELLYSDEYQSKLKWQINIDNKKKIGKYNCSEAKIRINGRSYTVWFTLDVPVKLGPFKFHNLPGLVVEVIEDGGNFSLTLQKISKTKKTKDFETYKSYFLNKKKIYTYLEFEKKVVDVEVANKIRWIAEVKKIDLENGDSSETTVNDDLSNKSVIKEYIEYPLNLEYKLKQYQY